MNNEMPITLSRLKSVRRCSSSVFEIQLKSLERYTFSKSEINSLACFMNNNISTLRTYLTTSITSFSPPNPNFIVKPAIANVLELVTAIKTEKDLTIELEYETAILTFYSFIHFSGKYLSFTLSRHIVVRNGAGNLVCVLGVDVVKALIKFIEDPDCC